MAIQTLTLNVNAQPSAEDRAFLYLSQNENGRDKSIIGRYVANEIKRRYTRG